ncbi:glycoside hydrolase family 99-like domain-containing protein [Flavilitoribacter nigricans]|uniref:Glycosyltransferase 2-like domain-containing protein n=1 Tax=Flavilitoribacter nigricans (strain ATCC 23147 / DSM 23189 / NBRC 102662 / NCIMB 1420 / SS-2) TaxID=1122177 RepID=A0A2D0NF79_FLAN2|nr:glycoside hydrolase family 99-like domain-containing protein [Flavilitoribacter nigricans]PHN06443.1 hypothetical protein CRP01_12815 [Flavilitoribacter nigricans DSM 23189 = NBRC 102662]
MNVVLTKQELKEFLKDFKNIIVSGPQRSGTTFAGFAISELLGLPYYTEEAFGVHNESRFFDLTKTSDKKVIQCPALSHVLDKIESKEETIVVWMVRPVEDIIRSENRINWQEEGREKAKYVSRLNAFFRKEELQGIHFRQPISSIKYQFWEEYQKLQIPHFIEIQYAELSTIFSDSWIDAQNRKEFNSRQINQVADPAFLSQRLFLCQLFIDYGDGYNENFSYLSTVHTGNNKVSFEIPTVPGKKVQSIRFDPANEPVIIEIQSIVISPDHQALHSRAENGQFSFQNRYYFNHNDPQLVIQIPEGLEISGGQVTINLVVEAIGADALQQLYVDHTQKLREEGSAENTELATQIQAYKNAHETSLATLQEKEAIQQKLQAYIDHLQIAHSTEQLSSAQKHQGELGRKDQEIEELKNTNLSLEEGNRDLNDRIAEEKNLRQQEAATSSELRARLTELEAENDRIQSELSQENREKEALTAQISEKSTLISSLEQKIDEINILHAQLQETAKQRTEQSHAFQQQAEVSRQRLQNLTDHADRLESENHNLRNSLSFKAGWLLTAPFRWIYEIFRGNRIGLWFNLLLVAIRKPFTLISKLRWEHFRILSQAIRKESPAQIIHNFQKFLTGAPSQTANNTLPSPQSQQALPAAEKEKPVSLQVTPASLPVPVDASPSIIRDITKFQNPGPEFLPRLEKELNLDPDPLLKLIAFYLPQFHTIPENDKFWGKGFTEWTNVTKGVPRFSGHYQPRLPADFGFYSLSSRETIARQVELAKKAGLFGFCFHYYWFSGTRLLEKPLDLFIEDQSIDFNFCLCWANENWTKRWDGMDQEVIIKQDFTAEDTVAFIEDLKPYLRDKRYIYLNGRPLIIIYRPQLIPDIKKTAATWRMNLIEAGIGNPILCAAQAFGLHDPEEVGFDVVVEFPPHKLAFDKKNRRDEYYIYDENYQGVIINYEDIVAASMSETTHPYPLFRGLFPSWDNEARKKGKGATYHGSSPEQFEQWLQFVSEYALANPVQDNSLVFINAWNEWAEGAYLEPDQYFGYQYLHRVQSVSERFNFRKHKVIVVSHDAHLHGAQLNVLAKAKTLKRQFGLEITILLLDTGALEPEFERVARTYNIRDYVQADRTGLLHLLKKLKREGYDYAIVNTTVANNILPELDAAGIQSLSLIHELPNLIKEYRLEDEVRFVAEKADHIFFSTKTVERGFRGFQPQISGRVNIRPQGIYAFDLYAVDTIPAGALRKQLDLGPEDIVIASLGFADMRKGIDLFVQVADFVSRRNQNCHFVWIGNIHGVLDPWIRHDIEKLPYRENIHLVPFHDKISEYIKDIDIFVLTAREDPFPSVVLESLAMGAPGIVFAGSGGIVELNDQFPDLLTIVPYLDTEAMGKAVLNLADHPEQRLQLANYGKKVMADHFSYDDYCFFLAQQFDPSLKKVSVIVPNYNYAHTLEDRLRSIWYQEYPVFEVIVLDDCSTDNSLEKIRELAEKYQRKIRIIENETNSGSPFLQWQKGANEARGDLVWIAEADDLAEPGFLSALVPLFANEELGLAYSQSKQIDENGNHLAGDYLYYTDDIDPQKWRQDYVIEGPREILEGLAVKNTILNVSAVVWRLDLLRELMAEHLDELREFKVAGDWFLYIKALERAQLGFCAQSLNVHRRHSSSVTHKLNVDRHLEEIRLIQEMVKSQEQFPDKLADIQNDYYSSVETALRN